MVRFIDLFQPLARFTPDVASAERKVAFNEKMIWTAIVLIAYLVMAQVPLFGIGKGGAEDPFGAMRVIFASNRGTLMELGIGPIVTAGLILQILQGSRMIDVDMSNPEDRSLFTSASKIMAVVMTLFEALAYIIGGAYGTITVQTQFIIVVQLLAAGIILMLLDELLQKGWGIGSGISLFIAAGVAQTIWWDSIAPVSPVADKKYLGSLIAFGQSIQNWQGWKEALYRPQGLPDMIGFLTTITIILLVVYLMGLRVEVPVSYAKYRGFRGKFPIKLLYVSNIPVIFTAALFGNIYFISQIIWSKYNQAGTNFWLNLLGKFTVSGQSYQPTSGLVYYVTAPRNLAGVMQDPVRALVYAGLMIVICVFFAVTWVEVGGMDSKTVAKQLLDSGMQIEGFRRSSSPIEQVLSRYIPTVTILGGLLVGVLAAFADFLGAFGSGTGILLTVGIIEQYYELLAKERISEMYPGIGGLLGKR
jgi:protein transport protein SEC61 subunit alpha